MGWILVLNDKIRQRRKAQIDPILNFVFYPISKAKIKAYKMKNNEINLHLIDVNGEEFAFNAKDLSEIKSLKEMLASYDQNSVTINIRPIDGPHYQLKIQYKVMTTRECSRCGIEFEKIADKKHEDYLSTELKEGEDEGFVLIEKPEKWDWAEYLRQTIELDMPYQELCKEDCKPEDDRVLIGETDKSVNSPFNKLKDVKIPKKH